MTAAVNIEDYKIKAMRTLANDDFNWENASYHALTEKASYHASFGGDDQKGKNTYCYIQDIQSGNYFPI